MSVSGNNSLQGVAYTAMTDLKNLPDDIHALIFDCDGTLVDTPPVYAKAWASGFLLSGETMKPEWYLARAGLSEYVLMDAFEALHNVKLERDAVVRQMRQSFIEGLSELREIEAIAAVARHYRGKMPMAVASGGSQEIVSATLRATGLAELFDTIVTLDDVGRAKPAPDLFVEAAKRLGIPPHSCLVFEDSREGLEAAHRAGMRALDVVTILQPVPRNS
jgi:HAD superfamily hydrolase (TIGR01509 family)